MDIEHKGDTTIIRVDNPTKYILLPIQEEKDEAQVLLDTGNGSVLSMIVGYMDSKNSDAHFASMKAYWANYATLDRRSHQPWHIFLLP